MLASVHVDGSVWHVATTRVGNTDTKTMPMSSMYAVGASALLAFAWCCGLSRRQQREEREQQDEERRRSREHHQRRQAQEEERQRSARLQQRLQQQQDEERRRSMEHHQRRQAQAEERQRSARLQQQERRPTAVRQQQDEERRRPTERQLWGQMAAKADTFIRARRKFNTASPTEYACQLDTIGRELPTFHNWRALFDVYDGEQFVLSADRRSVSVKNLTPFQGERSHRVFGHFRCACRRPALKTWTSAVTWKDSWQKCNACEAKIYPHEQHTLDASGESTADVESRQPHDMARCQRCREQGSLCVPHLYFAA